MIDGNEVSIGLLTALLRQVFQKRFAELPRAHKSVVVTTLHQNGLLWKQIAYAVGYSTSYVNELHVDPNGVKSRRRKATYGRLCAGGCGRITSGYNGRGKAPLRCYECARIKAVMDLEYRANKPSGKKKWSDEECLEALRRVVALTGRGVSKASYNALRRPDDPEGQTLMNRWDTWWGACAAAGVPTVNSRHRRFYRRITDKECHAAFYLVADDLSRPPTMSEYEQYSKLHPELELPSESIMRKRSGSWSGLIKDWVSQHEKV